MKRLLLVVDYQKDFVDGALGFPGAEALDGPIAAKIAACRAAGDDVAFTLDTHGPDYLDTQEGRKLPVPHCIGGTEGHKIYGQVGQSCDAEDWCFIKYTFGSDAMYDFLKQNRYSSIELVGVVTNICVMANAVLAKTAQPETEIIVDARCVASNDPALQEKTLDVMESLQITVTGREEA